MVKVSSYEKNIDYPFEIPQGYRKINKEEIKILEKNQNINEDSTWENFYVSDIPGDFSPDLIHFSFFSGLIIIGRLQNVKLSYNDLHLKAGITKSRLKDVFVGNDCAIHNVSYLENYILKDRVILFDVKEICCTKHSKFGNGILKKGEPESNRVWIGVANENDGRAVLPFESMIPADAYLWSHYRNDSELLQRFKELTEKGNSGELNTVGFIDSDVVIKESNIIKDAKIGKCTYIKGALKLKNITILSSEEEVSQIGEGVEMVNGILGYGCRIFYQAIAIRFVIGRNCQVKYGARILNSVLGDNSTISCCEVLNNLIFPFHEQHHNSSFLIATTIMGQSNIASGATIGSNHNSRSPDGEIFAKRGFWPGLCSDFKHNSRFASFVLVSKGSYQHELDIQYPFSLVAPGQNGDEALHIIPAWWFMYDMFAITRNKNKFLKRDKRVVRVQNIEFDPLAPDTMQEVLTALIRIINLTEEYLISTNNPYMQGKETFEEKFQSAKDFLHQNPQANFKLKDPLCQKKFGAIIIKPVQAYKTYRMILKYYAARTLLEYVKYKNYDHLTMDLVQRIREIPLYTEWENVGGQIIPSVKIRELFALIKSKEIDSWEQIHDFYNQCEKKYKDYELRFSFYILEQLYSRTVEDFNKEVFQDIINDVCHVAELIYVESMKSREKDYTDYYRTMVYQSREEMENILGALSENEFLKNLKLDILEFISDINRYGKDLI